MPVQRNGILYIDLIACDLAKPLIRSSGFLVDSLGSSLYIIYVYYQVIYKGRWLYFFLLICTPLLCLAVLHWLVLETVIKGNVLALFPILVEKYSVFCY